MKWTILFCFRGRRARRSPGTRTAGINRAAGGGANQNHSDRTPTYTGGLLRIKGKMTETPPETAFSVYSLQPQNSASFDLETE